MAHEVYYQLFQTPGQLRWVGSRGGKATARNRRDRRNCAAQRPKLQSETEPLVQRETTAAAIALLDAQYPWLRGVEKRLSSSANAA